MKHMIDTPHHWINRLGFALRKELVQRFHDAGYKASAEEWGALLTLSQGQCTPSDLSDLSLRDRTTVTRLVDRLVAKGWVLRNPDPQDRRRLLLGLSPEGQAVFGQMAKVAERLVADSTAGIPEVEQALAVTVMQKIYANLEAGGQDGRV